MTPHGEGLSELRQSLIKARKKSELTQGQVAEAVGIDRSFYTHIERGDRTPSLDIAIRIARALGKQVEDIFRPEEVAVRHNEEAAVALA